MKYIRTKDGRIVKHPHPNAEIFTFRYEILKTANTIEDLCDEFVAVDIGITKDREKHYKTLEEAKIDKNFLFDRLYGAIWTNKGLIYVAKMNEKGELELI